MCMLGVAAEICRCRGRCREVVSRVPSWQACGQNSWEGGDDGQLPVHTCQRLMIQNCTYMFQNDHDLFLPQSPSVLLVGQLRNAAKVGDARSPAKAQLADSRGISHVFTGCHLQIQHRQWGWWCVRLGSRIPRPYTLRTMAGSIRQPIDVESLARYLESHVPAVKLPLDIKQVRALHCA